MENVSCVFSFWNLSFTARNLSFTPPLFTRESYPHILRKNEKVCEDS